MFKSDGINYDNVRPKANLLSSKKINFHDKKDLIKNVKREKSIRFSKKSNLIFFLLCLSFSLFISFNILKVTYKKEINLSTIHSSKGLEYDIVICPYLWDQSKKASESKGPLWKDNNKESKENGELYGSINLVFIIYHFSFTRK